MRNKYINHFFSLKCAQDLLPFFTGCKKNAAKEVTESFSAYHNCLEHFGVLDDSWVVYSVGDGKRPRTGATFRLLTKAAHVHSIDPATDLEWISGPLKDIYHVELRNYSAWNCKVEDIVYAPENFSKGKNVLILGVHSHAQISESIKKLAFRAKSVNIFWMPCCNQIERKYLDKDYIAKCDKFVTYNDEEVWSAKNQVYLWKNIPI
jgi:hypothetical protein